MPFQLIAYRRSPWIASRRTNGKIDSTIIARIAWELGCSPNARHGPTSGGTCLNELLWRRSFDCDVELGAVLAFLIGRPRSGFPSFTERLGYVCRFPFRIPDFFVDLGRRADQFGDDMNRERTQRCQLTESKTLALSKTRNSSSRFAATRKFLAVPRAAFPARSSESANPKTFKAKFST